MSCMPQNPSCARSQPFSEVSQPCRRSRGAVRAPGRQNHCSSPRLSLSRSQQRGPAHFQAAMIIDGSRLVVTDNSGAKEVECIKTRGRYASIGDIITCSVKKAIKGKVSQVRQAARAGCFACSWGCPQRVCGAWAARQRLVES